eukprot:4243179-Alexandrium_andersonii.AAC.1
MGKATLCKRLPHLQFDVGQSRAGYAPRERPSVSFGGYVCFCTEILQLRCCLCTPPVSAAVGCFAAPAHASPIGCIWQCGADCAASRR